MPVSLFICMTCTSVFHVVCAICLALRLPLVLPLHNDLCEAKFYKLEGKSLNGNVTERLLTRDMLDCSLLCVNAFKKKSCLSFNFGGTKEQGLYECELNNLDMNLKLENVQDRQGFAYYGMTEEDLYRLFPCLSTPCRNGGSCVEGPALEMFTCNCPLEIRVLPYVDNICNVDNSLVKQTPPVQGVFQAHVVLYQQNYFEAERLYEILGATLASLDQLTAAWETGLQRCSWGWLIDAYAAYPMQEAISGCGNKIGIIGGKTVYDKAKRELNAWCYKNAT